MKAKVIALLQKVWADLVDTYERCKVAIILIGAAIIYLEWAHIKAAFLVLAAQKEQKTDHKEDSVLATQESTANTQADALVKEAAVITAQQPTVTEDWYEKSKK